MTSTRFKAVLGLAALAVAIGFLLTVSHSAEALIGDSPLIGCDSKNGVILVEVELNKGVVQARATDRFLLETSGTVDKNGTVFGVDPRDDTIVGVKDDGIRKGSTVLLPLSIAPPEGVDGVVDVSMDIKLILEDEAGNRHVLDESSGEASGCDLGGELPAPQA